MMTHGPPQRGDTRVRIRPGSAMRLQYQRQLQQQQAQHDPHRTPGRALPEKQHQTRHNPVTDAGNIPGFRQDEQ
jgi:hypothetical protein